MFHQREKPGYSRPYPLELIPRYHHGARSAASKLSDPYFIEHTHAARVALSPFGCILLGRRCGLSVFPSPLPLSLKNSGRISLNVSPISIFKSLSPVTGSSPRVSLEVPSLPASALLSSVIVLADRVEVSKVLSPTVGHHAPPKELRMRPATPRPGWTLDVNSV